MKNNIRQYNIIPVGEKVIVNDNFEGMIISISLRKNSIVYEVQQTNEDGIRVIWANDWEITSIHKMDLAITNLIKKMEVKFMNFKELKKENKELKDKLATANGAMKESLIAFDKMVTHYEKQLKQQDKELARRLTIIHYLETKALKGFE